MPARLGLSRLSAMKPKFLAAMAVAAALLLILCLRVGRHLDRPCIVLMSVDTLRADHLGCYGYPLATSPRIDAFAGECVQFMQAFSQAPSTAASHMSLFTGLMPPVHRITNTVAGDMSDLQRLSPAIATLAEILKANGYLTAGFHGGSNVSGAFGFDRGFDLYSDKAIHWGRIYHASKPLRSIRAWLQKSRRERKPLFLFLHHYICHDPYLNAPQPIHDRFAKNPPPGLPSTWADLDMKANPGKSPRELFWKNVDGKNEEHRRQIVSLYDACINYSDFIVGSIRKILKEEGQYDRSLVILLSDHGEEFWDHGDILHWRLFREALHVPLLVKFPGAAHAGMRIVTPVRMFDVMPTVLEFLGIRSARPLQATSLLPLVRGEPWSAPRVVSFSDQFDYVRILDGDSAYSSQPSHGTGEWLFDLRRDPLERQNLAEGRPPLLTHLRALGAAICRRQEALRRRVGSDRGPRVPVDDNLKKQLDSLGYL